MELGRLYIHMQKNGTRFLPLTSHKNQLKVDHRPKYEGARKKHRGTLQDIDMRTGKCLKQWST
jgi:hypothetical protein